MITLRVDVVIPTRDRPRMLGEAVERVLAQRGRLGRVIVVNDGTSDVRRGLPGHPALEVVINQRRTGAPGARNTGLRLATAPWIVFHDDDDLWDENFIEIMSPRALIAQSEVVALFPGYRIAFPDGAVRIAPPAQSSPSQDQVLLSNVVGPTSFVLCRTEAVRAVNGFDETLPGAQDWDLWVRLAEHRVLDPVAEVLGTYRVHRLGQISASEPGERFRRYRPFFDKRLAHSRAPVHRKAFADEAYWWGVLAAWTGDIAAAADALDWARRCYPNHLKAAIMRIIALSPLRRALLRMIYGKRRNRMRIEDRGEPLEMG